MSCGDRIGFGLGRAMRRPAVLLIRLAGAVALVGVTVLVGAAALGGSSASAAGCAVAWWSSR